MIPQNSIDVTPETATTDGDPHVFFVDFNAVESLHIDNETLLNATGRGKVMATTFDSNFQT